MLPLGDYPGAIGREARYVDQYLGREYIPASPGGWPEGPLEVITRTYEIVLRGVGGLLGQDPELLDFAFGVLFRYDPPG